MSELIKVKNYKKENYVTIQLNCVLNTKLSWRAKGIHLYFMSRPPGWDINHTDLINKSTDGKDSLNSGIQELIDNKYLYKFNERNTKGQYIATQYVVFEKPIDITEENLKIAMATDKDPRDYAIHSGLPATGKPSTGNPPYSNKDISNKDYSIGINTDVLIPSNWRCLAENLLNHWNNLTIDIKDITKHKIDPELKVSFYNKKKKNKNDPENIPLYQYVSGINLTEAEIIDAITNYITVIQSDNMWYNHKYKTLPQFLLSDNFKSFLSVNKPLDKYSIKGYINSYFDEVRIKTKWLYLDFNPKMVLDTAKQTYMGVDLDIIKLRNVKFLFDEIKLVLKINKFSRGDLIEIEQCMACLIYHKKDEELLREIYTFWEEHKSLIERI